MANTTTTQFLRDDHRSLTGLFRQFEAVDSRAPEMKRPLVLQICSSLELHSRLEEELFYPAVREAGDLAAKALVDKSLEDHRSLSSLMAQIRDRDVREEHFNARMLELIATVELHVDEEERDLFPLAEQVLSGVSPKLANQLSALKDELLGTDEFRPARPESAQDPNGGEQIRKTSGTEAA